MWPFLIIVVVQSVVTLLFVIVFVRYFRLWLISLLSGVPVSLAALIGMSLRRINPSVIVNGRIAALKAGLDISVGQLENHYVARGDVPRVIQALVLAKQGGLALTFDQAAAIDLAHRDVLSEVENSIPAIGANKEI